MGDERALVIDLIIIIAAAAAGGVLASSLRLPSIIGFLLAGLVVEHYIPGLDIELERVQDLAELGVALLLFALGLKFSFRGLADVRRVALVGGGAQILITIALGLLVGLALGIDVRASLVLGFAMSLSSTMVVLKLLEDRNESETLYGRIALGILLVQDLAVVPMMILVGASADATGLALLGELGIAAGKALLLLGAAYVLGTRIVPWLLARVAAFGSRDVFLLVSLSLGLGLAGTSFTLGLSIAFGAFLAGLVISESEFSYQALAEVLPLREVFATIFFVTLGMLIDPAVLMDEPGRVAAIAAAVIVGKLVVVVIAVAVLRYPARRALLVGLALAQMGEFSFVLAQVGIDEGVISDSLSSAILMSALVSIVFTPLLVGAGPRVAGWLAERRPLAQLFRDPVVREVGGDEADLQQHVVICGYGLVGRELVQEVVRRGFRCIVIEENPYLVEELHKAGIPHVFGDATNPEVLAVCAIDRARIMAITIPDPAGARLVLAHVARINADLDVIVRGRSREDHDALMEAGAEEVVQPEFEAGLEFVRHTLHRFGVDSTQIQALLARRRRDVHWHEREGS